VYDITSPTITEVTTTLGTALIRKKLGTEVPFTLVFSELVKSSAALTVTFETSASSDNSTTVPKGPPAVTSGQHESYVTTWSNSAALSKTGVLVIVAGDYSTDLEVLSVSTSGSITDAADNAMTDFTIPDGSNLDDVYEVFVDGVDPHITKVTSDPDIEALALDETADINIYFNEVVTLNQSITFMLSSDAAGSGFEVSEVLPGIDDNGDEVSVASYEYQVAEGDYESSALYISTITALSVKDISLNEVTSLTTPVGQKLSDNSTLTVETVNPVIDDITTTSSTGVFGEGATISITVNFINGAAGSAETVTMGGSASGIINIGYNDPVVINNGTATFTTVDASGFSVTGDYTVSSTDIDGSITVESVAVTGDFTDVAGNDADASVASATIFAGKTITVDVTKPAITTITTSDYATTDSPTLKEGASVAILLNFGEPVRLTSGNVTVTFNTGGTATITAPVTSTSALEATYTIGAGETTEGITPSERLEIETIELAASGTITDNPTYSADDGTYKPNNIATAGLIPATGLGDGGWTIEVDGVFPYFSSVISTNADNTYGINDVISITANFNEPVYFAQSLSLPISGLVTNPTFASIAQADAANNAVTSFTVASGDNSLGLPIDLSSAVIKNNNGEVYDVVGNKMATAGLTLPDDSNITDGPAGFNQIIIDGVRPSAPQEVTLTPHGGSATLDNSSDYETYFNSTNTHLKVTVGFYDGSDGTMETGAIYLEANIGNAGWEALNPDGAVAITNDDAVTRNCYRITAADWSSATKEAEILVGVATIATLATATLTSGTLTQGQLNGQTINIRAKLIDNADNISGTGWAAGTYTSATSTLEIDTQLPDLTTISYVSMTARAQPHPLATDIDLRLTFDDEVTLIDNGQIIISLNVGSPTITTVPFEYVAGVSGQFGQLDAEATLTGDATYTVGTTDYNTDDLEVDAISLSIDGVLRDVSGNSIIGSELTTDLASATNLSGVKVDGVMPSAPNIFDIAISPSPTYATSNANCNCEDFWNKGTDDAEFT
ncbi:uncharacterized protein METZ01_LOCUS112910, partial [marine metagenome]